MDNASYTTRRGEIEHYFDRTAVAAWERLTSDAPVGRIRATVRDRRSLFARGSDSSRETVLLTRPTSAAICRISSPRARSSRIR